MAALKKKAQKFENNKSDVPIEKWAYEKYLKRKRGRDFFVSNME